MSEEELEKEYLEKEYQRFCLHIYLNRPYSFDVKAWFFEHRKYFGFRKTVNDFRYLVRGPTEPPGKP